MDLDKVNFFLQEIYRGCLQMSPDLLQLPHHLRGREEETHLWAAGPETRHPLQRLPQRQLRLRPLSREDGLYHRRQGDRHGGGRGDHQAVRGLPSDAGPDRALSGWWHLLGQSRPPGSQSSEVWQASRGSQDHLHLHGPGESLWRVSDTQQDKYFSTISCPATLRTRLGSSWQPRVGL